MAKKSMIAREKRRKIASARHWASRSALRKQVSDLNLSQEERWLAVVKLQKRPRDQSHIRVCHRCRACGRPHGVLRRFGLCRCCLRSLWMRGEIPGLLKASW